MYLPGAIKIDRLAHDKKRWARSDNERGDPV
jgi:hypothetical protein